MKPFQRLLYIAIGGWVVVAGASIALYPMSIGTTASIDLLRSLASVLPGIPTLVDALVARGERDLAVYSGYYVLLLCALWLALWIATYAAIARVQGPQPPFVAPAHTPNAFRRTRARFVFGAIFTGLAVTGFWWVPDPVGATSNREYVVDHPGALLMPALLLAGSPCFMALSHYWRAVNVAQRQRP